MHYYCRMQHKNIKTLGLLKKSLFSLFFSLFTVICASCWLPQQRSFFISWKQYSVNFKRHKWSFVPYIVSFSGLKMVFSTLSQLDITASIKNCVYNNSNLHYFMSSIIECPAPDVYTIFFFISSSVQIWLGLEILRNSSTIFTSNHIKSILKNFVTLIGKKHLSWGLFFIKVAGLQASNCIKKGLQYNYFLVNIEKFIRTPILKNICRWLLLHFWKLFWKNILQIIT